MSRRQARRCGTRSCGRCTSSASSLFLALCPSRCCGTCSPRRSTCTCSDRDRPKGAMKAMPNLDRDVARDVRRIGGRGLHVEAAARHRRLHDVRPVHQRVPRPRHGQAAGPARDRVEDRRGHGRRPRRTVTSARRLGIDAEITISSNSLFERITAEEIWACTSCKACDEICPVNIEILDKILDMRRYLSLMESNFPAELGTAYRAMENQGNPWGMNQGERGDWAKDFDDVTVVDPGEPMTAEYLYWVGLRRIVRRQEQEGHPGDGQAVAPGRHRRGDPRAERDVHRRLGAAQRQRVPVPDAGDAEHRDAQRHGRAQDHRPVPPLLQHVEERVPAARRQLRSHPPHAAARVS